MTEPNDLERRVRAIEDRREIEDVIVRYANACDFQDDEMLGSCFTDDATASFAGVPVGPGGAAIVAFLASMRGMPIIGSMHRFGNVVVNIDGDEADVQSRAVVYGVRGDPQQLRLRGISYHDRFVRTAAGWRIARREHSPSWEGAADSVPLTPIRRPDA
jgi:ketosteroid isomerase-like protein